MANRNGNSNTQSGATLGKIPVHASLSPIPQRHGVMMIEPGCASDYAYMRSDQLASLLHLMRQEQGRAFRSLDIDRQDALMWLASQIADELEETLPLLLAEKAATAAGGAQ